MNLTFLKPPPKHLTKCLLLLCAFSFFSVQIFGQNEKFKAMFIYNFIKYIEWPPASDEKVFTIFVLGESPIQSELESIAKLKKAGNSSIEVKKINSVSEVKNSHILYLPEQKKKTLSEICALLKGKPVLIISDEAQGDFAINFVEMDQKQKFQVSRSKIESHGLKVNSTLLTLGIPVD